jgi:hypothetical protein
MKGLQLPQFHQVRNDLERLLANRDRQLLQHYRVGQLKVGR